MKNKLLITSALAGGLMAGSIANAQTYYEKGNNYGQSTTTVGGDLALTYSAIRKTGGTITNNTAGVNSTRGFGRESQLNISNRGKLSNGMDYAAGFSLEFDGTGTSSTQNATEAPSISNENVYFDLIAGNTTLTAGVDHIQRGYNGAIPQVYNITELMYGVGSRTTYVIGAKTSEAAGVGIMQKIPSLGITASAYYAPRSGDTGAAEMDNVVSSLGTNSSYEVGFNGVNTLGVTGLTTSFFFNKMDKSNTTLQDVKGISYGVGYNFGTIAFGFDKFKDQGRGAIATAAGNELGESSNTASRVTKRYGATYAVDSALTLGLVKATTDTTGSAFAANNGNTETIKALQIGYNFGPVAFSGTFAKFDNLDGASGAVKEDSGRSAQLRLNTKF
jgi:hypothetical protein